MSVSLDRYRASVDDGMSYVFQGLWHWLTAFILWFSKKGKQIISKNGPIRRELVGVYPAYELRFYSTRKASRALFRLVFSENFCLPLFSEDVNIKGAGDDEVLLQEFAFEKLTISDCTPQIFPLVLLSDIVRYFRNQEKRTCQFSSFPPLWSVTTG